MRKRQGNAAEPTVVPMLDPEVAAHIRLLQRLGWGTGRMPSEVVLARKIVRCYLRQGAASEKQSPGARTLDADERKVARAARRPRQAMQSSCNAGRGPAAHAAARASPHAATRAAEPAAARFRDAARAPAADRLWRERIDLAGERTST
jgi:hypothetical protein